MCCEGAGVFFTGKVGGVKAGAAVAAFSRAKKWHFERPNLRTDSKNLVSRQF